MPHCASRLCLRHYAIVCRYAEPPPLASQHYLRLPTIALIFATPAADLFSRRHADDYWRQRRYAPLRAAASAATPMLMAALLSFRDCQPLSPCRHFRQPPPLARPLTPPPYFILPCRHFRLPLSIIRHCRHFAISFVSDAALSITFHYASHAAASASAILTPLRH